MTRDLFKDNRPSLWREQDKLAAAIVKVRSKQKKQLLTRALCTSLASMTRKPRRSL